MFFSGYFQTIFPTPCCGAIGVMFSPAQSDSFNLCQISLLFHTKHVRPHSSDFRLCLLSSATSFGVQVRRVVVVVGDFSVDGNERTKERTNANGGGTKASLTSNAAAVPPARARHRPAALPSDQDEKLGGRVINCFIAHFSAPLIDRL